MRSLLHFLHDMNWEVANSERMRVMKRQQLHIGQNDRMWRVQTPQPRERERYAAVD